MNKPIIALLLSTFVLGACFRHSASLEGIYSRFDETEFGGRFKGFIKSPTEHIIVETEQRFVVREIRGVLHSAGGEWPELTEVIFEIRGPSPTTKVRTVVADRRGRFHMESVAAGVYTFKATANGWQSVVGTITVTKGATAHEIDLQLPLGV